MPEKAKKTERRKFPRVKKSLPFKIKSGEFDIVAETQNLSRSGVYCQINRPLTPMTKVGITMLIPALSGNNTTTKKISCEGVVVRTDASKQVKGKYEVAIFFSQIRRRDAEKIADYVNYHLQRETL